MVRRSSEIELAGILVAALGFGLTRLIVAETVDADAVVPFLVAGAVSLVIGLGITVFGVALAIGSFRRTYVRTVATWTYLGTAAMAVVLGLTAAEAVFRSGSPTTVLESNVLVANVLLGGAVGGAVIGDRSAASRRRREEIERQADRAVLINRILRHEVLNSATVVRGYSDLLVTHTSSESVDAIREAADRIETTVEDVGDLAAADESPLGRVDLTTATKAVLSEYDDSSVESDLESVDVLADERIAIVVRELLENALVHGRERAVVASGADSPTGDRSSVSVTVGAAGSVAELRISDAGAGLPARQHDLLESGRLPEYDDPTAGFGLQRVRLLVERYEGSIAVETEGGTTITITLPRAPETTESGSALGIDGNRLGAAAVASIVAGLAMGLYLQYAQGLLPVIGALYGVDNAVVGWITHLFHSVVFGLVFAAGTVRPAARRYHGVAARTGLGIAWGVVLWLVAAGVVMPAWLTAVGVQAVVPNLTGPGLVSHVLWGGVLGGLYTVLADRFDRTSTTSIRRPWR
ncbi:ATP-binding protein [Natrarchaeobius oligotrophus]|uniref:histidine kinase n=1 Tax=Natrarchaeobius chitinivorans TaxID=1679083 RepID=A0A3N6MJF1_NATCH|nr:ATP-binding protein [Natrarchaeobius chitinivorans]RQH01435.1 histidine kinase [Natrarchaeobius chitinivorans]